MPIEDESEFDVRLGFEVIRAGTRAWWSAGADFAGEHDKALARLHPLKPDCERFFVVRLRIEEGRVRRSG